MTPADWAIYPKLIDIAKRRNPKSVLIHSGNQEQEEMISREFQCPRTFLYKKDWNFNNPAPIKETWDAIFLFNVMMYSPDPHLWIKHLAANCKYIYIQDLCKRKRSKHGQLGPDRDRARYSYLIEPKYDYQYDLSQEKLVSYVQYSGTPNSFDPAPIHFIAEIEGGAN